MKKWTRGGEGIIGKWYDRQEARAQQICLSYIPERKVGWTSSQISFFSPRFIFLCFAVLSSPLDTKGREREDKTTLDIRQEKRNPSFNFDEISRKTLINEIRIFFLTSQWTNEEKWDDGMMEGWMDQLHTIILRILLGNLTDWLIDLLRDRIIKIPDQNNGLPSTRTQSSQARLWKWRMF